ncbi:sphingosine hydroxylase [Flammula alnicola]|nr:sphingosine hydroxylase [Flammula alnicola]KAF8972608.1 sphingosine hydroxylase [Flammula alnicola]
MNSTLCPSLISDDPLCFTTTTFPFYFSPKARLVDGVSDFILTLIAPVVAYWSLSLFFHYLDISGWKWLDKYRIHESSEVQAKNLATRTEVVWAVIFQQVIQTVLGLVWLSDESVQRINHPQELRRLAAMIEPVLSTVLGNSMSPLVLARAADLVYWWAIPGFQLLAAMFIIDTWQYFLHRLMHVNKFLYKQFHSWHHRLYVPYAFGSLYNHPVEGFLLDSLGALVAEWSTGMSTRQAMLLFTFSTLKTVDDHCGYSLPWDPLQMLTGNNADYHDIHHQVIGIKSNFAQPFFVHWDTLLGTRMTRQDINHRRQKNLKAQ